jgi:hypothetical protein
MRQADINRAIRSLAYLKTPDRVRAGVRNTYGIAVPLDRVALVLGTMNAERSNRAKEQEPTEADGWDFDVRVNPNVRPLIARPVAKRDRPALRAKEPLPAHVPAPSPNPFVGPFQLKVLAASIAQDFDTTAADILGKARFRRLILPRLVLTKLCIEQGMSCAQIGRKMGGRDHSTILHQRDMFEPYSALYPEIVASYRRHVALRDEARGGGQ